MHVYIMYACYSYGYSYSYGYKYIHIYVLLLKSNVKYLTSFTGDGKSL